MPVRARCLTSSGFTTRDWPAADRLERLGRRDQMDPHDLLELL